MKMITNQAYELGAAEADGSNHINSVEPVAQLLTLSHQEKVALCKRLQRWRASNSGLMLEKRGLPLPGRVI